MFKRKSIVFVAHPYVKGYAKLKDVKQSQLVRNYSDSTCINSLQFEELQEKMGKDNIVLQWKS